LNGKFHDYTKFSVVKIGKYVQKRLQKLCQNVSFRCFGTIIADISMKPDDLEVLEVLEILENPENTTQTKTTQI